MVTAAVAIVCPAVLGAAAATVTQSIATSALVGSAISGIMNGAASVKAGKSFFDGFASGVEEGAIIGALCGMFGAGTAAMMTGAEMTVGNVFAARVINAVGDATIGTATYIYHENKYDKAITGGDVAKTWAECAITSFVLRSVFEGGKSSSKADGKNRGMSTSKGRVESESSITCETSYGKSSSNCTELVPYYPANNGAESGTPSGFYQDANGRWHRPNGDFASNAEVGIASPAKTATGSHGNSLSDPRTNYGYVLVDKDTNEILKFGETLYPETRYSKSYLEQNNAVMKVLESGSKEYIHYWPVSYTHLRAHET